MALNKLDALFDEAVIRLRDAGRVMDAERLDGANAMIQRMVSDQQSWASPDGSEGDLAARLRFVVENAEVALRILERQRVGGPDGGITPATAAADWGRA